MTPSIDYKSTLALMAGLTRPASPVSRGVWRSALHELETVSIAANIGIVAEFGARNRVR